MSINKSLFMLSTDRDYIKILGEYSITFYNKKYYKIEKGKLIRLFDKKEFSLSKI